jgi:hypothetical protein
MAKLEVLAVTSIQRLFSGMSRRVVYEQGDKADGSGSAPCETLVNVWYLQNTAVFQHEFICFLFRKEPRVFRFQCIALRSSLALDTPPQGHSTLPPGGRPAAQALRYLGFYLNIRVLSVYCHGNVYFLFLKSYRQALTAERFTFSNTK